LYEGSSDLFNFKPHEIDPKKSDKEFFVASLGNSIIKRADKKTSRHFCRDANSIFTRALIVDAD